MNENVSLLWALGPSEMVLLAIAALFIFGPKRLPELGQALGEGLSSFRNASQSSAKLLSPPVQETPGPAEDEGNLKEVTLNGRTGRHQAAHS